MFCQTSSNKGHQTLAAIAAGDRSPSLRPASVCAGIGAGLGCKRLAQTVLTVLASSWAFSTAALPDDADQPIHISSKEAVWEKVGTATYNGDVTVNQGTLEIIADKVTVEFEDERVVRVTASGEPAHYKQKLEGDQAPVRADAKTIVYHTRDERIDLEGKAHLNQKGNEFRGETIAYDVRAGRVNAATKTDKKIRMVLQPKRSAPKKDQENNSQ